MVFVCIDNRKNTGFQVLHRVDAFLWRKASYSKWSIYQVHLAFLWQKVVNAPWPVKFYLEPKESWKAQPQLLMRTSIDYWFDAYCSVVVQKLRPLTDLRKDAIGF